MNQESQLSSAEKKGNGKVFYGCGGCGCLLALILIPLGIFMMAMAGDSHMSELGPFGFILTPIAFLIGIISIVLIVIGLIINKKKD